MKHSHSGSSLGARLASAMKRRGVGNAEVARVAGVHEKTVSKWRNDVQSPGDEELAKVAAFLDASPSELRYGEEAGSGRLSEDPPSYVPSLPQELRVAAKEFELEAMKLGADDDAVAYIHRMLTSQEAVALYHGGYREPATMDAMRKRQEGIIIGLRIWLGEYLKQQALEARQREAARD